MNHATDIDRQAAQWLVRLDGEPTEAIRQEFESWLAADLRHRVAYLRLSSVWAKTGVLRSLAPTGAQVDADLLKPSSSWLGCPLPLVRLGAAVLLAACALLLVWEIRPGADVYLTGVGAYSRVLLADGSMVALNTDSKVLVRLTRALREITLVRGEALFTVAHDVARPFDVHAGTIVVRAVGTAFDVRRRDARDVEVVVTNGKVVVRAEPNALGVAAQPMGSAVVAAGETATARPSGFEVRKIDRLDASRRLAWQAGDWSFQDETLAEVVSEFNRYSHRHLELADPSLQDLRVSGNFDLSDIDSFVEALHASFGLVASPDSQGTLQLRRATVSTDAIPPPDQQTSNGDSASIRHMP